MKNEERGKSPKMFDDKELQTLLSKDAIQTQKEFAEQMNVTHKAVSLRLKVLGKMQKM